MKKNHNNTFTMKKYYNPLLAAILISSSLFAGGNNDKQILTEKEQARFTQSMRGNGLCFTQNKGQIADMEGNVRPDILYKAAGGGADIYLRTTGISYVYSNMSEVQHEVHEKVEELIKAGIIKESDEHNYEDSLMQKELIKVHQVDMDFAGCDKSFRTINEDAAEGYNNYYYAHCPNGVLNVKQYNKVTCKNIYNGIDVVYGGGTENACLPKQGQSGGRQGLKYDIVVQPHADPNQIKLQWNGTENIHINNEGSLVIKTNINEFTESIPKVYQNINGKIVDVSAKYVLNGTTVNFKLGTWNPEYVLVIDPFVWSTYYDGPGRDDLHDLAVDATGNSFITGLTFGSFPVNAGFQMVFAGNMDAYVVKFDGAGVRLWATYYGGSNSDYSWGIAADINGNIFITGQTKSNNFPVLGGFQMVFGGGGFTGDAYVVKFDGTGARIWATYYGGSGDDQGFDIATDGGGNVFITGGTGSANFPILGIAGGYNQAILSGTADAFVVKFNASGTPLWATYYGGTGNYENPTGIATDANGNVFITGSATSTTLPVFAIAGGYNQLANAGPAGSSDAFIVKFDGNGARLWATYYGGTSDEQAKGIATDSNGNVVIVGWTKSADFPTGAAAGNNVFQLVFGGGTYGDAFVVKFTSNGSRLWATYHGGNADDYGFYCAVDKNKNIYVFGEFEDSGPGNFPMNTCALQKTFAGGPYMGNEDFFVTKFNPRGNRICSTFIGGNLEDELDFGGGIACFQNYVYIAGNSIGGGFPVTAGAWQPIYGGGNLDPVVAKFCGNSCGDNNPVTIDFTNSPVTLCVNTPIQFNSSFTTTLTCDTNIYQWFFPGGIPATSTQRNPGGIVYNAAGTYIVKLLVSSVCSGNDTVIKTITIGNCGCSLSATATITTNITCNGTSNGAASITITNGAGGPYTYSWSTGTSGITTSTTIPITGLSAAPYTVTISEGSCTSTSNFTVIAPPPLVGQFTKGTANCTDCGCKQWIMVTTTGGTNPYTYSWPDGYTNRYKNQLCPGNYTINIIDKNGCNINVNLSAP